MKKCISLIAIMLCCLIFVGCGSRLPVSNQFILLSIVNQSDGSLTQSLTFSLCTDELKQANATETNVEEIRDKLVQNVKIFRDEFYLNFAIVYNQNPKEEYKIGEALKISDVTYNQSVDAVSFSMTFASQDVWNYYHPKTDDNNSGSNLEYGFMITSSSTGVFPFSSEMTISGQKMTVGQRYMNAYLEALATCNIGFDYKPDFVYDYGTTASYIKSDSEYYFTEQQVYHHVWMRNYDEYLEKNTIQLYISQPNRGVWYAVALGGTLLALGVAVLIITLKNKKQPK